MNEKIYNSYVSLGWLQLEWQGKKRLIQWSRYGSPSTGDWSCAPHANILEYRKGHSTFNIATLPRAQ